MTEQESNKAEFKTALYLATDQKFDPWAVYTQAWVEMDAFTNVLCSVHNYWGIKFNPKTESHYYEKETQEWVGGKLITIKDKFAAFGTQYQAMTIYMEKIRHYYPNAYDNRDNYRKFFCGLTNGTYRWATLPGYELILIRKYEELKDAGEFTL